MCTGRAGSPPSTPLPAAVRAAAGPPRRPPRRAGWDRNRRHRPRTGWQPAHPPGGHRHGGEPGHSQQFVRAVPGQQHRAAALGRPQCGGGVRLGWRVRLRSRRPRRLGPVMVRIQNRQLHGQLQIGQQPPHHRRGASPGVVGQVGGEGTVRPRVARSACSSTAREFNLPEDQHTDRLGIRGQRCDRPSECRRQRAGHRLRNLGRNTFDAFPRRARANSSSGAGGVSSSASSFGSATGAGPASASGFADFRPAPSWNSGSRLTGAAAPARPGPGPW